MPAVALRPPTPAPFRIDNANPPHTGLVSQVVPMRERKRMAIGTGGRATPGLLSSVFGVVVIDAMSVAAHEDRS